MFHSPVIWAKWILIFLCAYHGVSRSPNMNSSNTSGGTQVEPSRTEISLAVKSTGCTRSNASTFTVYSSG